MRIRHLRLAPCPSVRKQPIELAVFGRFANWMRKPRGPKNWQWRAVTLPIPFGLTLVLYWHLKGEARPIRAARFHEFVHVRQRRDLGLFRYYWTWVSQAIRFGYRNCSMEQDAYLAEAEAARKGWPSWV